MFSELKKIWYDTTTFEGRYVAKDVRNSVAFLVGICLVVTSALGACFGKVIDLGAGTTLLAYSLGGQGMKELFKYKNNTLTSSNSGPPEDNDTPDLTKNQEPG